MLNFIKLTKEEITELEKEIESRAVKQLRKLFKLEVQEQKKGGVK